MVNLLNSVPSEVSCGLVLGADMPLRPCEMVATGRGDLGEAMTLSYGTELLPRSLLPMDD
jgi:hypothetical protein